MQRRHARDSTGLPPPLLRPTPRRTRLSAPGALVLVAAIAQLVAGVWGGSEMHRRAKMSERRVALFASERIAVGAEVIRVQRRGGGDDRRTTVHYRYVAGGREQTGSTTVRRQDRDRHSVGSQVAVWYLPSEPSASWMENDTPERRALWPAFWIPAGGIAIVVVAIALLRRQADLLACGRPAVAVVTKVDKKRSDNGTRWRVNYEWTLLSGAIRQGHYNTKKQPPVVGTVMPIVYDRERPLRNRRYPFPFVALSEK